MASVHHIGVRRSHEHGIPARYVDNREGRQWQPGRVQWSSTLHLLGRHGSRPDHRQRDYGHLVRRHSQSEVTEDTTSTSTNPFERVFGWVLGAAKTRGPVGRRRAVWLDVFCDALQAACRASPRYDVKEAAYAYHPAPMVRAREEHGSLRDMESHPEPGVACIEAARGRRVGRYRWDIPEI
jgi:hypothetical protein